MLIVESETVAAASASLRELHCTAVNSDHEQSPWSILDRDRQSVSAARRGQYSARWLGIKRWQRCTLVWWWWSHYDLTTSPCRVHCDVLSRVSQSVEAAASWCSPDCRLYRWSFSTWFLRYFRHCCFFCMQQLFLNNYSPAFYYLCYTIVWWLSVFVNCTEIQWRALGSCLPSVPHRGQKLFTSMTVDSSLKMHHNAPNGWASPADPVESEATKGDE